MTCSYHPGASTGHVIQKELFLQEPDAPHWLTPITKKLFSLEDFHWWVQPSGNVLNSRTITLSFWLPSRTWWCKTSPQCPQRKQHWCKYVLMRSTFIFQWSLTFKQEDHDCVDLTARLSNPSSHMQADVMRLQKAAQIVGLNIEQHNVNIFWENRWWRWQTKQGSVFSSRSRRVRVRIPAS